MNEIHKIAKSVIADLELVRMRRGLTQGQVCDRMGVERTTIARWQRRAEQGHPITLRTMCRWANALDCDADVLFRESGQTGKSVNI